MKNTKAHQQKSRLEALMAKYGKTKIDLGDIYRPLSDSESLSVNTPDSMTNELHSAMDTLIERVGNLDDYVAQKLDYKNLNELYASFSAEQIDAIALAIYNIEEKGEGIIIADQTGIGKGRIAAGLVRYAIKKNRLPIFITEKANLFSDFFRDLKAIGSAQYQPFIVNAREDKSNIKDEDGNIVYTALMKPDQDKVFESGNVPSTFKYVMMTYSQVSGGEYNAKGQFVGKSKKLSFLEKISYGSIIIMDESHNAAGLSNTGENLTKIARNSSGIMFLSATFAKRSDNMPIYAQKTCMKEAQLSAEAISVAMSKGGVALQEIISADLVAQGQLVRRERTFEGVEINYITTTKFGAEQRKTSDSITEIIRLIIEFQDKYVTPEIEELDKIYASENGTVEIRKGTKSGGVDNQPFVSKIFNSINQLLFGIKVDAIVERAVKRLSEGKKPVIAFSSTMGSFVQDLIESGVAKPGDDAEFNANFSTVLTKGLEGVLRYTIKDDGGNSEYGMVNIFELSEEAQLMYSFIKSKIANASSNISISPIDNIIQGIEAYGYKVAEVTGREYRVTLSRRNGNWYGTVDRRKKELANDAFRKFNDNEVDVLLINQSGSTGASAHAIVTKKVPKSEVKQRVMIVGQAELDINREVQKRGRIMRTGQILLPIYDYLTSDVPAEKRLSMMLQKKLKSLDANTTSNQKNSEALMKSDDFLNKYGDKIVAEWLAENLDINKLLGEPLNLKVDADGNVNTDKLEIPEGTAHKVSGRVAILDSKKQEEFYDEVLRRYQNYVQVLIESDEYDLEVEVMNLRAESVSKQILIVNDNRGLSPFSDHTYIEEVLVDVLKKPFKTSEVRQKVEDVLQGQTADSYTRALIQEMTDANYARANELKKETEEEFSKKIKNIKTEPKYLKLKNEQDRAMYLMQKTEDLEEARDTKLSKIGREYGNKIQLLKENFQYFYPGKLVYIRADGSDSKTLGVVIGFSFGTNKNNKYTPSNISLKIAISNSKKQFTYDFTNRNIGEFDKIKGATGYARANGFEDTLMYYDRAIKESSKDRNTRHIVSGNLLQFYGSEFYPKGKLIEYTTIDGQTKKGGLLPESYTEDLRTSFKEDSNKTKVPVNKCLPVIQALNFNELLECTNKLTISINKYSGNYTIMVPKAKQQGGNIYLDQDLLQMVIDGNFLSIGQTMKAEVSQSYIMAVLDLLSIKHNISAELNKIQFDKIKSQFGEKRFEKQAKSNIRQNKPKPKTIYLTQTDYENEKGVSTNGDFEQAQKAKAQLQRLRLLAL